MKRRPPPSKPVAISDHALLRWLERVYGVDMEAFRSKLRDHVQAVANAGVSSWKAPDATYIFRDHTLITVLPPNSPAYHDPEFRR